MLELAFVALIAAPEFAQEHQAEIKAAIPSLKGVNFSTWAVTGNHVRNVLGEPANVYQSAVWSHAGTWRFCVCYYERPALLVTFYSKNLLVGPLPKNESIPADWEVYNIQRLRIPDSARDAVRLPID